MWLLVAFSDLRVAQFYVTAAAGEDFWYCEHGWIAPVVFCFRWTICVMAPICFTHVRLALPLPASNKIVQHRIQHPRHKPHTMTFSKFIIERNHPRDLRRYSIDIDPIYWINDESKRSKMILEFISIHSSLISLFVTRIGPLYVVLGLFLRVGGSRWRDWSDGQHKLLPFSWCGEKGFGCSTSAQVTTHPTASVSTRIAEDGHTTQMV